MCSNTSWIISCEVPLTQYIAVYHTAHVWVNCRPDDITIEISIFGYYSFVEVLELARPSNWSVKSPSFMRAWSPQFAVRSVMQDPRGFTSGPSSFVALDDVEHHVPWSVMPGTVWPGNHLKRHAWISESSSTTTTLIPSTNHYFNHHG